MSFDFHDAAAALLVDGRVVAAAHEERFSRRKNDAGLPVNAIRFCLAAGGLKPAEIDLVAYYEEPFLKFDRILACTQEAYPASSAYFEDTLRHWLLARKFEVRDRLAEHLGVPPSRIVYTRHHASHAAAAFFSSGFDEATVVTIDGVGEFETASIGVGRDRCLETLSSIHLPHSLGLFYSAWTAYLGFEVNEGEYKVMGMAAFGRPRFKDDVQKLFRLHEDGTFTLDQRLFSFRTPGELPFTQAVVDWLGPARVPESPFALDASDAGGGPGAPHVVERSRRYADIAASVQAVTEDVILHVVRTAVRRTGIARVCLAGGVALNSLANGRLTRELGVALYVHPAAGDAGGALGAALHHAYASDQAVGRRPLESVYLGQGFSASEVDAAIARAGFHVEGRYDSETDLVARVAALLAEGCVVGWFQGRSEYGPRALGNRSILADPTRRDMQRIVNEKIKFRERFRPFAPAVPVERATEYFDMPPVGRTTAPEYFMLAVHPVRPAYRAVLPAVTHEDGTARVQVVSRDSNRLFYDLLQAFGSLSGIPVLLNTSFNLRGEPIVNSPDDALRTFSLSGMDYLVLHRTILTRRVEF